MKNKPTNEEEDFDANQGKNLDAETERAKKLLENPNDEITQIFYNAAKVGENIELPKINENQISNNTDDNLYAF